VEEINEYGIGIKISPIPYHLASTEECEEFSFENSIPFESKDKPIFSMLEENSIWIYSSNDITSYHLTLDYHSNNLCYISQPMEKGWNKCRMEYKVIEDFD